MSQRINSRFLRFGKFAVNVTSISVRFMCFAHLYNQHVSELSLCLGPSMLPTFNMTGDVVLADHISGYFSKPNIGDVVICMAPHAPGRFVMKRVVGLPGDSVCFDVTTKERKYVEVPEGHLWLSGDNMSNSNDSRTYGPVPMGLLRGRVVARLWPEFQILENPLKQLNITDYFK
ncbi:peptidase S24/S26A/S26B/S26C [Phycomyces nitens]|nr:peptidase S24/S26A/S26B/S26C [Phycomyces nitens]